MGLDYLNKKVWHPGSMKNMQIVWEAEQKQKQINKRNRQREKKLVQEQHNEELKRIQVEAGLIPRSHLDRMQWMYDWGNKINQQKTNQEFLTGNKEAQPGEKKEFRHIFQEEITNRKCQDFQLLHEDPMYEIMKHEKARRDAIVNNPIEMKNIIKEVERQYMPQDFEQRKQKHLSSRRRPSSSSQSSSSESHRRKSKKKSKHRRQRSRSKDRNSRQRSREEHHADRKKEKFQEDIKSEKKSWKQSSNFKQYLKDRFGGILKQDEQGNFKPDYSIHKKKYKTQIQIDEEERRKKLEELRENAKKLQSLREKDRNHREEQREENFEKGVAKIRAEMFDNVRQNRNFKKYRASDQD